MGRVIGYDLTDSTAQISISMPTDEREEVQSVPVFAGTEKYVMPVTALIMPDGEIYYGEDVYAHRDEGGVTESGILSKAAEGDEKYETLLEGFIKKSMMLSSVVAPMNELERVVVTVPVPDDRYVRAIVKATRFLQDEGITVRITGYPECFFYYAMNQDAHLTMNKIALFDYNGTAVRTMLLSTRTDMRPHVSMVEERVFDLPMKDDLGFLGIARAVLDSEIVSAVYLSGEGFEGEWLKDSVTYLLERRRRVFQGRNLYTKGACYAGIDDRDGNPMLETCRFFDDDKVGSGIGIQVEQDGQETYVPLIEAGVNWYEAGGMTEFMLGEDQEIRIRMENFFTKDIRYSVIRADAFPKRPDRCTRVRLKVSMKDVSTMHCVAEDLGFGEIFASSKEAVEADIYL